MDFRFTLNMHNLNENDPRKSDCYIDITYNDIINCLGGDDILSCKEKSDVKDNICAPFYLISDINTPLTFDQADGYCFSEYGTHLFTNPDQFDYNTMKKWLNGTGIKAWIGLSRIPRSSTNWYWIDINQTEFIEGSSVIPTCSSSTPTPRNRLYQAYNNQMNWYEGEKFCLSTFGTNLASIHSAADNAAINTELADVGCSGYAWIGLNDRNRESNFEWSDGTDFVYNKWGIGQPNSCCQAQQDCAEYRRDNSFIWWNDWSCDLDNCIICNCWYFIYI